MFSDSILTAEVEKISGKENSVISNYTLELTFHTKFGDIKAQSVVSYSNEGDYANAYTDTIEVVVLMQPFDYTEKLQPSRSTLEATFVMRPTSTDGDEVIDMSPSMSQRFRVRLPEEKQDTVNGDSTKNLVENVRNQTPFMEVSLQLNDIFSDSLRAINVGGNYNKGTTPNILRALMDHFSRSDSNEYDFKGVDMFPSNNDVIRDNLIIPPRIKLVQLPGYVQANCGGVYSSDIGWYLVDGLWYIYPLYDVTRFDKERRTVTIIIGNSTAYPTISKSYRKSGNNLTIFSNKEPVTYDDTESRQQNLGSGTRFVDANKILGGFGKAEGNKYTIDDRNNVTEVTTYNREGGDVIAPVSKETIHSNAYSEFSVLARSNTVHVQVEWKQSDAKLIYPGMPAKLVYWNGNDIKEIKGTIVAKSVAAVRAGNANSTQYLQSTMLVVAVPKVI